MEGNGSMNGSASRSGPRRPGSRRGGLGRKGPGKSTLSGGSNNERSVRRLRLSKALTLPDSTTVADACRRMAARRVDACLLTDSSALLCGILTDRDLALKCVGEGLDVNTTLVSQIMTKNPVFVNVDSSAVDALLKMVQGRFRHLPVIENGEVVALLNITKCLYDAIARMERAADKGHAIAAAIEGVEKQFGEAASGFVETFREKIFRPTLGSIVGGDQAKLAVVHKSDAVLTAARKMKATRSSAAVVTNGSNNKPCGILTSKDILMRVLALSLRPEDTIVEKVMTPNPECVNQDTTIVDALHTMHDGKFLHLPVVDNDGNCVACVDVVHLTHGAMSSAAGTGADAAETSNTLMQRFWDSALALEPAEADDDSVSLRSGDVGDAMLSSIARGRAGSQAGDDAPFTFKMEDRKGRVHRFTCACDSMTELVCAVANRLGGDFDPDNPPSIMYDDEEGDKVVISVDDDLAAAVKFARACSLKGLKLYLDFHDDSGAMHNQQRQHKAPGGKPPRHQQPASKGQYNNYPGSYQNKAPPPREDDFSRWERSYQAYTWTMVGVTAVALASVGVALYLQRSK